MAVNFDLIILFSSFLGLVCAVFGIYLISKSRGKLRLSMAFLTLVSLTFAIGELINFLFLKGFINIFYLRDITDLLLALFLLFALFSLFLMIKSLKKR